MLTYATFSYLSLNWQMLFEHQALAGSFTKFVIFPTSLHWIKIRISQTHEEGPGVWALNFYLFFFYFILFFLLPAADAHTFLSHYLVSHIFPFGGKKWEKKENVSAFLRLNPQLHLTLDKGRNYFHFHPQQPRILQDRQRCRVMLQQRKSLSNI